MQDLSLNKMHQKQQGMTFLGMVIVIAAVVGVAFVAMKMVPAYTEFFEIRNIIRNMSSQSEFSQMSKNEIVQAFDKAASAGYVSSFKGSQLIIEKGDKGNAVTAEYQTIIPLVANISLLIDFRASSEK